MKIGLHAGTIELVPDLAQSTRNSTEAKTVYKAPLTVHLVDTARQINKRIAVVATIELSAQTSKSGVARLLVKTTIPWPVATPDELGNIKVDTSRDVSFHCVLTLPRGATTAIRSGNESFLHSAAAFCATMVEALVAPTFVRAVDEGGIDYPFGTGTSELQFSALGPGLITWYDAIKGKVFKDVDRTAAGTIAAMPDLIKSLATGLAPALPDLGADALVVPSAYIEAPV